MHKKVMFGAATALALVLSLPAASAQERGGNGMSAGGDRMPPGEQSQQAASRSHRGAAPMRGAGRQGAAQSSHGLSASEMRNRRAGANGRGTERTTVGQGQQPADEMRRGQRNTREMQNERSRRAQETNSNRERQTRSHANAARSAEPSRAGSRQSERAARQTARPENRESRRANARTETRHERSGGSQRASTRRNRHEASRRGSERVRLSERERTRISSSIARLHVRPITRVNFSVGVGVVVPASVRLEPLPADIVATVPEYRGYDFFVVNDQIAIVQPRTHRIVELLPYSGETTAAGYESVGRSRDERVRLSNAQRQTIRRVVTTRETTAEAPSEEEDVTIGETLPETVVVHEFPDTVYESVPTLRSYRYIVRDQDIYLVDPSSRRVIEEIE